MLPSAGVGPAFFIEDGAKGKRLILFTKDEKAFCTKEKERKVFWYTSTPKVGAQFAPGLFSHCENERAEGSGDPTLFGALPNFLWEGILFVFTKKGRGGLGYTHSTKQAKDKQEVEGLFFCIETVLVRGIGNEAGSTKGIFGIIHQIKLVIIIVMKNNEKMGLGCLWSLNIPTWDFPMAVGWFDDKSCYANG